MHPILESLVGTPYEWLKNLLYAYNSGNIDAFNTISNSGEFLKEVKKILKFNNYYIIYI